LSSHVIVLQKCTYEALSHIFKHGKGGREIDSLCEYRKVMMGLGGSGLQSDMPALEVTYYLLF